MAKPKAVEAIRARVIEKARSVDFAAMSRDEYGDWINSLPADEFMQLLALYDEFKSGLWPNGIGEPPRSSP